MIRNTKFLQETPDRRQGVITLNKLLYSFKQQPYNLHCWMTGSSKEVSYTSSCYISCY